MATAVRPNLPTHLTAFVGREADLHSLRSLLRSSRLVTLTGTGGAGKSRLAAEAARTSSAAWPDGVFWVELADESHVSAAVVRRLELPGRGAPAEVAASWLESRQALLILDNCEHVIAESASFSQLLLQRCPGLTILATSREPLGVPGESRWPVSPLGDPDALSLFEVRARLVLPDFKVGAPNRPSVVAICDRLDRLPLAIEMAAARLDLMSEHELLANLNDRFRILASGARTVPERQQTMAAAIDWSYRLLTPDEARLFRRLAVFQGGFTLEAAWTVGANGDTLALLNGLVHKSMVVADRLEDGSTRYRLLESHHDFAQEKLLESGESDAIRRRHYQYFRSQRWKPRDSPNFWAALAWARDHVEDAGLALAVQLAESEFSDQARMGALLMDRLALAPLGDATRVGGLNLAGRLASRQADHATGRRLADESIALARELRDAELLANALRGAGVVYHASGELDVARRMYDEALELLQGVADRTLAVDVQNQIGLIANERGEFAQAVEILNECVAFSRSKGDTGPLERYLESFANAQFGLGDVDGAAASWSEALAICRERNDPFGQIWSLGGLALVAAAHKDDERALRLAALIDRMSREFSFSTWSTRVRQLRDATERIQKKLGERRSEAIWKEGQELSDSRGLEYALGSGQPAGADVSKDAGPLSRREREVAAMVAAGMTNKEIAARLFIAERTAEGHVERIRNKLGVRSRTEVATWAVAHGLVSRRP
ncbi:MAG TPA: LuxR C-terminal-related transcriptional regulator [Candidatus Dormibacteraeota bacterium]|nr:LuxR C-terminal-related transcriptional regulator [Candidatus Dormibacteraeota bacterium]